MADSSQDHISQYLSDARKRGCLACSSKHCPDSLRVPIRVWRPAATLEALCRSPLMKTRGANPARVERVPEMSAVTRPKVVLARRPTAEWASDSGAGTSATAWRTLSIRAKILYPEVAKQLPAGTTWGRRKTDEASGVTASAGPKT